MTARTTASTQTEIRRYLVNPHVAALLIDCPLCTAAVHRHCFGRVDSPHTARYRAALYWLRANATPRYAGGRHAQLSR